MSVFLPKIVAIDSGLLSDLTRDATSSDRQRTDQANATIELLNQSHLVPLITFEHVLELIQYGDDKVVEARIEVLRGLTCIATPRSTHDPSGIGSTLDLDAAEVMAIYIGRRRTVQDVVRQVRSHAFNMGSPRDLLRSVRGSLPQLRDLARARRARSSQIASLSHVEFHRHGGKKLSRFMSQMAPSAAPTAEEIEWLTRTLTEQLASKGDKDLPDPRALAEAFTRTTAVEFAELGRHGGASLISAMCRQFGVDERAVHEDLTLADFCLMGTYQAQLNILTERLALPPSLSEYEIPSSLRPGWVVRRALDDHRRKGMRADGSDLLDSMLATLCCYADITIVDRRTQEFLTQAQRSHPLLVELMRTIATLSGYGELDKLA